MSKEAVKRTQQEEAPQRKAESGFPVAKQELRRRERLEG
jgi:hypothetical protein